MPQNLGLRIGTDESVRLLLEVTEGMDYRKLKAAYDRQTRADEATPRQMFQAVIFGAMSGAFSTRALEAACRTT
jgi:transposase